MSASIDFDQPQIKREFALWLAITVILVAGIAFCWDPTPLAQGLAAIFIGCALVHAALSYGVGMAPIFFAVCVVVTFAVENVGAATGFPFGHYHFVVGGDLPHIGRIPIIVGPLWFGGGYFSFVVASTLLDGAHQQPDRSASTVAVPLIAAFVLTQWDLVIDAPNATIAGAWIWHDGGAVYGVPLSNYLGWLATSWLFFQIFALILRERTRRSGSASRSSPKLQLVAILLPERGPHPRRPVHDRTKRRGRRRCRQGLAHSGHPRGDRRNFRADYAVHRTARSSPPLGVPSNAPQ
jgi:putative membrane protein